MINPYFQADLDAIKRVAERQHRRALRADNQRAIAITAFAAEQAETHDNPAPYQAIRQLKEFPATIDEFVDSEEFLGNVVDVWATLRADLREINPDVFAGESAVYEALLGGATATGKTTLASITTLYQLYLCTCLQDPQEVFGLNQTTRIIFMLMSVLPQVTERAIYRPLRDMFERMPYAQEQLTWNRQRTQALELEGGLSIVPATANIQAILGQAVIGGILDEVNFMTVVEQSRRVPGPRGLGGRYDQAEEICRSTSRRRKSRFLTQGISLGCLCVISSTRYRDDFLDRRMAEAREHDEAGVVQIRHKQYEVQSPETYCGETFRLLVGNNDYPTHILHDDVITPEGGMVENVPVEYKTEFRRDPENALRDIVGIATDTISPFIGQRQKIGDAIAAGRELDLKPWVDKSEVDLELDGFPQWLEANLPEDRDALRFVHIDLAVTNDACGVAIVKFAGMVEQASESGPGVVETLPKFVVEAAIRIQPSKAAELQIAELRSWILQLPTCYRLNIAMISYDGFQSRESIQILRKVGIRAEAISVDRNLEPYEYLRSALYQGRLAMVDSEPLRLELAQLELDAKRDKVDHPPRGSKDVADAVCGAVYAASRWRSIRTGLGCQDQDGNSTRAKVREGERRQDMGRREGKERRNIRRRELPRREGAGLYRPSRKQRIHDSYRRQRAREESE